MTEEKLKTNFKRRCDEIKFKQDEGNNSVEQIRLDDSRRNKLSKRH